MAEKDAKNEIVLVGVLKNKRDFEILMRKNWYRVPADFAPKRKFDYLAFYQPLEFGKRGKRIIYFARVLSTQKIKRISLMSDEPNHPRANDDYIRFGVGKIRMLTRAIENTIPRRIVFGFTTLNRLMSSKDILELYSIAPTEQILEKALKKSGIRYVSQQYVSCGKKRYRPDFTILCKNGRIAIECDNTKAHSGVRQNIKDRIKDACLREFGWTVVRFSENEILFDLKKCLSRTKRTIRLLGGIV